MAIVSNQKAGEGLSLPSKARQRQRKRAKAKAEFLAKPGKGKDKDKGKASSKKLCLLHHHQQQQQQPAAASQPSQSSSLAMSHGHKCWAKVPVGCKNHASEPQKHNSQYFVLLAIFWPSFGSLFFRGVARFSGCGVVLAPFLQGASAIASMKQSEGGSWPVRRSSCGRSGGTAMACLERHPGSKSDSLKPRFLSSQCSTGTMGMQAQASSSWRGCNLATWLSG